MPPKRKIRNLPNANDKGRMNQLAFFDPVYQNDSLQMNHGESDSEESIDAGLSRQTFRDRTQDESNETLDAVSMTQSSRDNPTNDLFDQEQSSEISMTKISSRINQIEQSLQQAQHMLESMERFKHLVPGTQEQGEKLRVIIANLEEQKAGYVNLLNLITLTNDERSELVNRIAASQGLLPTNNEDQSNDEDDEDEVTSRRQIQSPIRPRIESKIGFTPQPIIPTTPTVPPTINSSDNEQNNRNDNSNYDSLVGSLKSDTINWKDQQLTSDDEASDAENGKEIERNLMLQKEQLRALQGQKRALLAIKKRSEQRLLEQQQQLTSKKPTNTKVDASEKDLLSDINNLRDRLKLLRGLYEQKHQVEVQQLKSPSKKPSAPADNRMKNLQHVRDQLDELEKMVTYYQVDAMETQEEETTVYEEAPIPPADAQRLKSLIMQQKQQTSSSTIDTIDQDDRAKPLDRLSNELAAKRLELEQAKSALSRLQQMVKTIEPDECSSSVRSTPVPPTNNKSTHNDNYESNGNPKTSLLSSILSSNPVESKKSLATGNGYADAKMAAQHREIERLLESRQRLHTLKDQIANLHQSMTTPPIPSKKESVNSAQGKPSKAKPSANSYENNPRNIRVTYSADNPDDDDSELYRFDCESGDGEEIDDESEEEEEEIQPRIKQGNFRAPEDIVAEHEQRLLTKKSTSTEELSDRMREMCRCLTTFMQEQKAFNRHIEERLITDTRRPPSPRPPTTTAAAPANDPVFNQLQQQVLTQGLIVNLNSAYREIAVLQAEINALQSENTRLASSVSSSDNAYQYRPQVYSRGNSKESIYSLEQIKPLRAQARSRYDEETRILTSNNKFENSSKTSFNSQSTGQQTAIHCEKTDLERTPTKHERTDRLSSPKPVHLHSKENISKGFVIRRRPMFNDQEPSLIQSQLFNYNQPQEFDIEDEDDDDDDDEDDESVNEQQINDLSKTIFNIQPSAYYTSTARELDNIDVQTLDLQIKSIMVQLIPFMRLHINDRFTQTILNHIRERIIFLFKQQPDSAPLIRQFQNQFSDSLGKTIEKYCGTTICDCAHDLIRDISDVIFEELVKYKFYENVNQTVRINVDEQISSMDDGENENKYQIELAESENRPLNLIGSDEEDNDADQEENKDSELETAVSRQESNLTSNELPSSTELHSNGHEYVLVNRSTSEENTVAETQSNKNENSPIQES